MASKMILPILPLACLIHLLGMILKAMIGCAYANDRDVFEGCHCFEVVLYFASLPVYIVKAKLIKELLNINQNSRRP
jgi:hypothetical protein